MKNINILDLSQFNEADFGQEFYINTIENHIKQTHLHIDKPHKHNFYVTVLFTKGSGKHEIDFVHYDIVPGSVFFLNPGQVHHWELSADISGYIFFHTQSFFEKDFTHNHIHNFPFFYHQQNYAKIDLEGRNTLYITSLFISIYNENKIDLSFRAEKIITLIHLIYIECSRLYFEKNLPEQIVQNGYARKFKSFQDMVEQHYKTEKSASQYATWLHMSAKHLNRIIQNIIGKTTTEYIIERVMLEAKREMIHQKKNLNEIALDLGYDDYAYFSRLFKKHFNENPSDFINRYP